MRRTTLMLFEIANSADSDRATSMADARIALCIEKGVDMDDIDPASGYDNSARAYDRARASWVDLVRQHGASPFYEVPDIEWARGLWARKRPDFLEGDDWLSAGLDEHRKFIAERDLTCRKTDCLVHNPLPDF
ncbi:hypothetical protein [Streptomyces sp. DT117]|uniref:hypothetical protein n=1 Tax=Streptomyces sp. DT117 TaxID=3393422 RepID=UPI003CF3F7AD